MLCKNSVKIYKPHEASHRRILRLVRHVDTHALVDLQDREQELIRLLSYSSQGSGQQVGGGD